MLKYFILLFIFLFNINVNATTINLYGDSLSLGYGYILKNDYKKCKINNLGIVSTGLLNQRSINWYTRIKYLNENTRPDIVILSFGANDAGLNISKKILWNSKEWKEEYKTRLESIIKLIYLNNKNTKIIFMGIPIFIKDRARQDNNYILKNIQDEVLDKYNIYKPVLIDIQTSKYKEKDGIHYNKIGYRQAINIMINSDEILKKEMSKCYR